MRARGFDHLTPLSWRRYDRAPSRKLTARIPCHQKKIGEGAHYGRKAAHLHAIAAQLAGIVTKVAVTDDQAVSQGDVIVWIDGRMPRRQQAQAAGSGQLLDRGGTDLWVIADFHAAVMAGLQPGKSVVVGEGG